MSGAASKALDRLRWRRSGEVEHGDRITPAETPIALVHDGGTTAVMMATPSDLEDFAVGFSLTEGVVEDAAGIRDLEVVETGLGIEVRMWLVVPAGQRLAARRRHLAGPTGCGLCGIDSLEEARRAFPRLAESAFRIRPGVLLEAIEALSAAQPLGAQTRAVHAAGFWRDGVLLAVREDVGRHNALDKLVGALARGPGLPNGEGVLLLTSRVSVEMVQKAAVLGAPVLCAVSAPTALAVQTAEAANLTLVAVARADGFEVFTHPRRIAFDR